VRTFSGLVSNPVLTSDRAKDSAAFGTVSDSLRTLGLSHISGVGCKARELGADPKTPWNVLCLDQLLRKAVSP
jgi:hypothetical protein